MYFPVCGVELNPLVLALIGLTVGALGGFFGAGGSFLINPMLFRLGMPMQYVVGTDLAHIVGKSIVAAKQHRAFGHVDTKLVAVMIPGTVLGNELGARIVEVLEKRGRVDQDIGIALAVVSVVISCFLIVEGILAIRRKDHPEHGHSHGFVRVTGWMQGLRLPPYVSLPASGIARISFWSVLSVSLLAGLVGGALGGGASYIRFPAMVYLLGIPTHVAVGSDLVEIVVSAGYGTFTHALKGNVDIMVALIMHTGGAVGAKLGAMLTRHVTGPRIRLAFAILPLLGAAMILQKLMGGR